MTLSRLNIVKQLSLTTYNHHQPKDFNCVPSLQVKIITLDPVYYQFLVILVTTNHSSLVIQDVEDQLEHQVRGQRPGVQQRHQLAVQAVHVDRGQRRGPSSSLVHHLQHGDDIIMCFQQTDNTFIQKHLRKAGDI